MKIDPWKVALPLFLFSGALLLVGLGNGYALWLSLLCFFLGSTFVLVDVWKRVFRS